MANAPTIDTAALELRWRDTLVRTAGTGLRIVEALARLRLRRGMSGSSAIEGTRPQG